MGIFYSIAKDHVIDFSKGGVYKTHLECGHFTALILRLVCVVIFYFITRVLFLVFNTNYLIDETEPFGFSYWFILFLGGLRFDIFVISIINAPYIVSTLLPFKFRQRNSYRKYTKLFLFYIPNIICLGFNFIDIIYSRFTHKRMTFDVFRFIESGNGFLELIPQFIKDFWYMFLLFFVFVSIFILLNQFIRVRYDGKNNYRGKYLISNISAFVLILGLCFIGARGGLQLRPITIVNASKYSMPQHYSLVLNTPFTLIKTMFYEGLVSKEFFDNEQLKQIYNPVFNPSLDSAISKYNIVVIILESFSLEYSSILNPNSDISYVPVLDSIGKKGFMMPAYSNGNRSMEGIPAILASIPTLMNNEYITSNYAENQITSFPNLLKKYGYTSAFFHGGKNGTLNFDSFTKISGFDYYYGKNEYGNDKDFDGSWGIYDDRFFKYFAGQLDTIQQPFFASLFTLSSHHPYELPDHYRNEFNIKENSVKESIKYADWSLGTFFETASKSKWFDNTLFILIADHASQQEDPLYKSPSGLFAIPFVMYHPSAGIPAVNKSFTQQLDVLPTVMDFINYPDQFFTFGNSIFNDEPPYCLNYTNNNYQLITDEHVILFDGEEVTSYHYIPEDPYLKNNLTNKLPLPNKEFDFLRAFIQTYNNSLIENKMMLERFNQ